MPSRPDACPAPEIHTLGEVVVEFGMLEFFLEAAIWHLLGTQEKARFLMAQALTAEMSFDRKVHAFASMFKLRDPGEDTVEFAALVKELFEVQAERNGLLHSVWHDSKTFGVFTRMKATAKAKGGLIRRIHPMPTERIAATRDKIVEVAKRLARFSMAHIQVEAGQQ
jgi:hypothetical protein